MKIIKPMLLVCAALILLCATLAAYAVWIEPKRLTVEVLKLGTGDTVFKVVQLSDLEISADYPEDRLQEMARRVNEQQADLVMFTGDLFSNYAQYGPLEAVQEALRQVEAKQGKLAVYGNNDYGGGASRIYEDLMTQAGFEVLVNQARTFSVGERSVWVGGMDDAQLGAPDWQMLAETREKANDYEILLTHEPSVPEGEKELPDLILAGHTHGGQVKLPFLADHLSYNGYLDGLYSLAGGAQLFVHHGMGTSQVPVRFGTPPQIAVFELAFGGEK